MKGDFYENDFAPVEFLPRSFMISDAEQLAGFIGDALRQRGHCRVFCDVLQRCWNMPPARQEEALKLFAKEHGWIVKIHEPAGYGTVADFSPDS